jgi:hypothetical protein
MVFPGVTTRAAFHVLHDDVPLLMIWKPRCKEAQRCAHFAFIDATTEALQAI